MKDILPDIVRWAEEGHRFAVATVIAVERSAPRGPGASLAVRDDGIVVGSVSGGCVEPAVYEEAESAIASGHSKRLTYGISDDQAFEVGLTCGGTIHLLVIPSVALNDLLDGLRERVENDEAVALAAVVTGASAGRSMLISESGSVGSLNNAGLEYSVTGDAAGMRELGESGLRFYGVDGERRPDDVEVFIHSMNPPPDMFVFGAIDFAAAVARIGKFLGYRVTVCDARETFATERRFPDADQVVVAWPHEFLERAAVDSRTVICVLTHDPKFDVPLLKKALRTPAAYIGAMGSRRTHEERLRLLREAGLDESELDRLSSPIGLDIGGSTPEEVAVSIAGEMIALRHGAGGGRLSEKDGPIHKRRDLVAGDQGSDSISG